MGFSSKCSIRPQEFDKAWCAPGRPPKSKSQGWEMCSLCWAGDQRNCGIKRQKLRDVVREVEPDLENPLIAKNAMSGAPGLVFCGNSLAAQILTNFACMHLVCCEFQHA